MSSIYSYYRANHGGRNNTGQITVRHRGATRFRRAFSYFPGYVGLSSAIAKYRLFSLKRFGSARFGACAKTSNTAYSFATFFNYSEERPPYLRCGAYAKGLALAKLYTVPFGAYVSQVQLASNGSPVVARARGSFVQLLKRRGSFVTLKLPSGEIRRVPAKYFSFSSSLPAYSVFLPKYRHAGELRRLGIRPSVRGCAINPVDHPHGGRTGESRPSVSPWGQLTKGYKTRSKAVNSRMVLLSVQQLKHNNRLLRLLLFTQYYINARSKIPICPRFSNF